MNLHDDQLPVGLMSQRSGFKSHHHNHHHPFFCLIPGDVSVPLKEQIQVTQSVMRKGSVRAKEMWLAPNVHYVKVASMA